VKSRNKIPSIKRIPVIRRYSAATRNRTSLEWRNRQTISFTRTELDAVALKYTAINGTLYPASTLNTNSTTLTPSSARTDISGLYPPRAAHIPYSHDDESTPSDLPPPDLVHDPTYAYHPPAVPVIPTDSPCVICLDPLLRLNSTTSHTSSTITTTTIISPDPLPTSSPPQQQNVSALTPPSTPPAPPPPPPQQTLRIISPCGHAFHARCLETWLLRRPQAAKRVGDGDGDDGAAQQQRGRGRRDTRTGPRCPLCWRELSL
jgi:hypothetical protein